MQGASCELLRFRIHVIFPNSTGISCNKCRSIFLKNHQTAVHHFTPPIILTCFLVVTSQADISEIFTVLISHCTTEAEPWSLDELNENAHRKYIGKSQISRNQYPRIFQYFTVSGKGTFYPPIFHLYDLVSDCDVFLNSIS